MASYKIKSKQRKSPYISLLSSGQLSARSPTIPCRSPIISSRVPLEVPSETLPRSPFTTQSFSNNSDSILSSPVYSLSSKPKETGSLLNTITSLFSSPASSKKLESGIKSPEHRDLVNFRYDSQIDNFSEHIHLMNRIIGSFVGFEPIACEYEINGKIMESDSGNKTYYFTSMTDVINLLEEIKEKLNLLLATKIFCSNELKYSDVCNVYFYSNKGGDLYESVMKNLPYYSSVKAHGIYVKTEFDNPVNSFTVGFFFRPLQQRPDIAKFFQ